MKFLRFSAMLLIAATLAFTACGGSTENSVSPGPSTKAITAFSIDGLSASGIISEAGHSIAIYVPNGTDLTALVPTITHTGASINPASGTAQDFTGQVTYTVTAVNGSMQDYIVTATKTVSITFEKNDTGAAGIMHKQAIATGLTMNLAANTFTMQGFKFAGWAETSEGSVAYGDKASYTMGTSDVTLYAMWSRWTKLLGANGVYTSTNSVSVDSNGNSYLIVGAAGDGNLDGQTISGNWSKFFVVKYNSSGIKQWLIPLGSFPDISVGKISADQSGNFFVTGYTTTDLDGETLTGGYENAFVMKYNSSGVKQWTELLGTELLGEAGAPASFSQIEGYSISADQSGNCYVTGTTADPVWGYLCTFTAKYNSSGENQWVKLLGETNKLTAYGYSISTDSGGNSYITGSTYSDLDGETKPDVYAIFTVKYDNSGNKQWTKLLGGNKSIMTKGISADSNGNCYITGYTEGAFDGQPKIGWSNVYLVKYDYAGTKQWTKFFGASNSYTHGSGIAVDSGNNIYVTGDTNGNLDGETSTGNYNAFVVKYNDSKIRQWTKLKGANAYGYSISIDSGDNIYVAGITYADFDGETYRGGGSLIPDLFITTIFNP
ncbi:MAG: hypothetical protein EPN93_06025 [Spirochaetes bacterium]|nr:MAG: hypothetical protein EPN93_06025 [Spirochaetota bacterium]